VVFSCKPEVGSCTADGEVTAGKTVGTVTDAITATSGELTASTDVTIVAGEPATIDITPASVELPVGGTQAFTVVVYDTAGALVENPAVSWTASTKLGEIDAAGVLTVGDTPGDYATGVTASIGPVKGVAEVIVPEDYDEDGMPDVAELEYGFDPTDSSDATEDADDDGIDNVTEVQGATDPTNADTDGDGAKDGEEDANQNGVLDPGETDPTSEDPTVYCDASATDTGCDAGFICENNGCVPEPVDPGDGDVIGGDVGTTTPGNDDGGCSNATTGSSGLPLALLVILLGATLWRRRRQRCQESG
jgi:MYXO-CTERM domain-containing protein